MGGAIKFKFKTMHAQREVHMRKGITALPVSKRRRISREIQKSIARAGSLFVGKMHRANLRYVENRFIPFLRRTLR